MSTATFRYKPLNHNFKAIHPNRAVDQIYIS